MEHLEKTLPESILKKLLEDDLDYLNKLQKGDLKFIRNLKTIDLVHSTKLSVEEAQILIKTLKIVYFKNKFRTANDIEDWWRLNTGCPSIDGIIRNGIALNGVNEIFGPSGAGKTQFCLQLSLMVQLPTECGGLEKGAIYISTEDIFPSKRLHQLSSHFTRKYLLKFNLEDNIYLKHLGDYEQLRQCILLKLPHFLETHKIGLIVIDSITGLFRSDNMDVSYVNRSKDFLTVVSKLNEFVSEYNLCVVCTNQVSVNLITQEEEPCLGLAWSNLLSGRFSISRKNEDGVREFKVVFAPDLPDAKSQFVITEKGLQSIS